MKNEKQNPYVTPAGNQKILTSLFLNIIQDQDYYLRHFGTPAAGNHARRNCMSGRLLLATTNTLSWCCCPAQKNMTVSPRHSTRSMSLVFTSVTG